MSHTPTPWEVENNIYGLCIVRHTPAPRSGWTTETIAVVATESITQTDRDNAELIVQAINAHEAMKSALNQLKSVLLVHQAIHPEYFGPVFDEVIAQTNQALALAEGKETP